MLSIFNNLNFSNITGNFFPFLGTCIMSSDINVILIHEIQTGATPDDNLYCLNQVINQVLLCASKLFSSRGLLSDTNVTLLVFKAALFSVSSLYHFQR